MSENRRIYVIDDEDGVRRSISFMLRTSGYDVISYASGIDFLRDVRALPLGCILLDIRMPDIDGLVVQQQLATNGNQSPVIVLTGHGDVATAVAAMKQGAVDFLEKPFEKSALLDALHNGFSRIEEVNAGDMQAQHAQSRISALTPRERDVLKGLVQGHPNKTIAYDLGISSRTVEIHRANLMKKLEAKSLSETLRIGFAARLTEEN